MWQPCPQTKEETVDFFEDLPHKKLPIWNPTVTVSYGCRREGMKKAVGHRATAEQNAIRTAAQRPIAMKCF